MVELVGDPCFPSQLIIPLHDGGSYTGVPGEIFISGLKLWFNSSTVLSGLDLEIITSG